MLPTWDMLVSAIFNYLLVLLGLTALDVILGIVTSLVKKTFDWECLTHYMQTDLLPILGWLAVKAILLIPPQYVPTSTGITEVIAAGVYATVFLQILGSILLSLQAFGILLPNQPPSTPPA